MSVSKDYIVPDLYCNESAEDVVLSTDANISVQHFHENLDSSSDEESSIAVAFDSEVDQFLDYSELKRRFCSSSGSVTSRIEVVNWMLKVHSYYNFRPETAYLSVNYLDRFLLSHSLPQGKGWSLQLLSVACLALAAKMEEISVPFLLDLQIMEPRFMFKPKTVQRMELMVLSILKWRLRPITPFDFLHYFIAKLERFGNFYSESYNNVISQASDIILRTCRVMDFLDYPPSTIAAASVVCLTDQYVDDQILGGFHQRVSGERLRKCYSLMKQKICLFSHTRKQIILQAVPPSPVVVMLDGDAIGGSCNAPKDWGDQNLKPRQSSLLNKC